MSFRKDHYMTISINTSEYSKNKNVEIDGVPFTVRPMTTADTLALMALERESKEKKSVRNSK